MRIAASFPLAINLLFDLEARVAVDGYFVRVEGVPQRCPAQ
jgi:hypothetical protein